MQLLKIARPDRKWYEIILWWELRRIPYNIFMYCAGMASFYIAYVNIPLVYLIIGLAFNLCYTLGWIVEIIFVSRLKDKTKLNYPRRAFLLYFFVSVLAVFSLSLHLRR